MAVHGETACSNPLTVASVSFDFARKSIAFSITRRTGWLFQAFSPASVCLFSASQFL
jgi:hypothetical protein